MIHLKPYGIAHNLLNFLHSKKNLHFYACIVLNLSRYLNLFIFKSKSCMFDEHHIVPKALVNVEREM
jgi:hypothetical protein